MRLGSSHICAADGNRIEVLVTQSNSSTIHTLTLR